MGAQIANERELSKNARKIAFASDSYSEEDFLS